MAGRTLVIGIDGCTPNIVEAMAKAGELPNIQRLINQGASGILKSTIIPNSFPAWVSCFTGVNEGKHRVFWMFLREDDYDNITLVNSYHISAKAVWEILSEYGYKSIVINTPCTYPASAFRFDGILISCWLTPSWDSDFVKPPWIKDEIKEAIGEYLFAPWDETKDRDEIIRLAKLGVRKRAELSAYLMKKYDWNLLWLVFTDTDAIQHYFWKDMDTSHPMHNPKAPQKYKQAIHDIYREVDKAVGLLLECLDESDNVFIISDHGFEPAFLSFDAHQFLYDKRLLSYKKIRNVRQTVKNILIRLNMLNYVRKIYNAFKENIRNKRVVEQLRNKEILIKEVYSGIDWSRTKAYSTFDSGISINLGGRNVQGIVNDDEYEKLRDFIIDELRKIKFPNGNQAFRAVVRREEAFKGKFTQKAADIIYYLDYTEGCQTKRTTRYFKPTDEWHTGNHNPYGIIIAKGPNIKAGMKIETKITDVTPTILYTMGLPLTEDMDGNVIDMFERRVEIRREGKSEINRAKEIVYKEEDEKKILDRLKALGYID